MNRYTDLFAPLIGRILVGGYFLWSGILAILNFPQTAANVQSAFSFHPVELAMVLVCAQVLGGIAMVVGLKTRSAALLLVIYSIITTLLYTNFLGGLGDQTTFLKNMAIIGGLFYISAYGSGNWSPEWNPRNRR